MRIPSTVRWLAVALSLGIGAVNGAGETGLFFDAPSFLGSQEPDFPPIFIIRGMPLGVSIPKSFGWTASGNPQVETVRLYSNSTGNEAPIGTAKKVGDEGSMPGPAGGGSNSGTNKPISTSPSKISGSRSSAAPTQTGNLRRSNTPVDDVKLTRMFEYSLLLSVPGGKRRAWILC